MRESNQTLPSVSSIAGLAFVVMACTAPEDPANVIDDSIELREGLPVAHPRDVGFDPLALHQLLRSSAEQETDALIIIKDGKLVIERYFADDDGAIPAGSITKTIVSVAIGLLVQEGRLSLDEPASNYISDWQNHSELGEITLRDLLSHTSGLDQNRAIEVDGSGFLPLGKHLAEARLDYPVGDTWIFNDNATDAAALIAQRVAGQDLADYIESALFEPLATDFGRWSRFPDGAPMGADQLSIRALALAKVGLLLSRGGVSPDGTRLLGEGWLAELTAPSSAFAPNYGLLCWRNAPAVAVGMTEDVVNYWQAKGVSESIVEKARTMIGLEYPSTGQFRAAWLPMLTDQEHIEMNAWQSDNPNFPLHRVLDVGLMRGYSAQGEFGQYLFVYPEYDLIAVRLHRVTEADLAPTAADTSFPDFIPQALALVATDAP